MKRGYGDDIANLRKILENPPYKTCTEKHFFREYIWVVFTCGFRAHTVKTHWGEIAEMTEMFSPPQTAQKSVEVLLQESPIKHNAKIKGIQNAAKRIADGFLQKIRELQSAEEVRNILKTLPYIGDVTVYHLMRNMGIDTFKPDRHIVHLAAGLDVTPKEMFDIILAETDEDHIGVADYILWKGCESLGSARKLLDCAQTDKDVPLPFKEQKMDDFLY